jgi:hypothetical protein
MRPILRCAATVAALALALALVLGACGTTGGNVISFEVTAQGAPSARETDTGLGWHVALSEAKLHIGAVYLNLAVPISGSQATACILPGIYTSEELAPLDVDVLSPAPQAFPEPATGTDDEVRTGEIWLTGGDVNAAADTTVIAQVAGTATRAAQAIPFSAKITISSANRGILGGSTALPSLHPICKQRIVSPIAIDLRPRNHGTLAITVDPSRWFANVDFTQLPPGGEFPDDNTNPASQNLFTGLRAATASFQLSFQ